MPDQGAIESIAKTALETVLGTEEGGLVTDGSLPAAEIGRLLIDILPQRILDRLAADGYTVVKAEVLRELEGAYVLEQVRAGNVGPIVPVPEGSEDEQ